jgi:isopenicillin-N N-acyltransferase like protein
MSLSLGSRWFCPLLACIGMLSVAAQGADPDKSKWVQGDSAVAAVIEKAQSGEHSQGSGYRFTIANGEAKVPVIVVGGTPYEMGWQIGSLMRDQIQAFVPAAVAGFKAQLQLTDEAVDQVWATTSAFTDDRVEQELAGLAEGSGVPVRSLQHAHCLPLLMPYSCSSIAAWGKATEDGHLYQTRNLDWSLEAGAHNFPVLAVYLPANGHPHVLPTFAGIIGANCGMSAAGIALSEMGDSPEKEMPYNVQAPHFTAWFRTLMYDADSLTEALDIFHRIPATKRYHFVFGDGRQEHRAVKIVSHSVEAPANRIHIWGDNDPQDELAPNVMPGVVYQDEGRGAFPILQREYGKLNAEKMVDLACKIPIKGGNVLDAVFDATALRLWVSYANTDAEAYQRPFVYLDIAALDGDHDGKSDLVEGGGDSDQDRLPDFLDPR